MQAQTHLSVSWPDTDFTKSTVQLDEIQSGGPPKDGIPAIDAPEFDSVEDAAEWIDPMEPVIVLTIGEDTKVYPLQVLIYHEIVNDVVGGIPVTVTFCPLCNASIVFDRRLDGIVLDFGTTGLLRMSDLVMYDRQTESWWQQFTGKAIIGKYVGSQLIRIPSSIAAFSSLMEAFPRAAVLNRNTGHIRPYGRNPYSGYDRIDQHPFLFDQAVDDRLAPMERVLSVTVNGQDKVYPFRELAKDVLINDQFEDVPIVVFATGKLLSALNERVISQSKTLIEATAWERRVEAYPDTLTFRSDGRGIRDEQTHSTWNVFGRAVQGKLMGSQLKSVDSGVHFAFAWLAFNPESEIYLSSKP